MSSIKFPLTEEGVVTISEYYQEFFYGNWKVDSDLWEELCSDLHNYYSLPDDYPKLHNEWYELGKYWIRDRGVGLDYFRNAQHYVLTERGE